MLTQILLPAQGPLVVHESIAQPRIPQTTKLKTSFETVFRSAFKVYLVPKNGLTPICLLL